MSFTIDINNGFKKIQANPGLSLMVQLAKNNIFVPSACGGKARCGYCRVKVISGGGDITAPEEPLMSPELRKEGYRLSCQLKPVEDISIEIPAELFSVKRYSAKVIGKKMLTYDIAGLRLELLSPNSIEFIPGQYVQLRSQPFDGKEAVIRSFSIASVPSDKNHIELMIRKVPNGICTAWVFDHLKEGENVSFSGPFGSFRLTDTNAPCLFIAGGSGMAPIWSILQSMREKGINRKCYYFFGALTQKDLFLVDELTALQKVLPDFTFVPALSNEPENSGWNGERGLITNVVAHHVPDCSNMEGYLCGSPGMIDACLNVLAKAGMPQNRIFYDKFV